LNWKRLRVVAGFIPFHCACYRAGTAAGGGCEIWLLVPPFQAFESLHLDPDHKELNSMTKSFQALGVSTPVVRALAARSIHAPFAIQEHVLPDALAGLDILAESPTGSGKTLAFGIPIVERTLGASGRPTALVLVPTRELALQVADDLRPLAQANRLRVATVYGGISVRPQAQTARNA